MAPNPKHFVVNPNWAALQQKLKSGVRLKQSPDSAPAVTSATGKRKDRAEEAEVEAEAPPASVLRPTSDDFSVTDVLAMDCEMVGVGSEGNKSALGRVTLVNTLGNIVYDEYVQPLERIIDFRTRISGIRPRDMKKAKKFQAVQMKIAELIKGRILVGHALHNDLKVLLLSHPKKDTRDSSCYEALLRDGRRRALKELALDVLGIKIQQNEHCPIEDARAVMLIYNKFRKAWEKSARDQLRLKRKHAGRCRKKQHPKKPLET